jgi:hypothetical protein
MSNAPSSNHGPATAMLDKALTAVGAVDSGSWSELMAGKTRLYALAEAHTS